MDNFVSKEIAILLKANGFNELCRYAYKEDKLLPYQHYSHTHKNKEDYQKNSNFDNAKVPTYSAPTISVVIQWLYDAKKIWIEVYPFGDDNDYPKWSYLIIDLTNNKSIIDNAFNTLEVSYEDLIANSYLTPINAYMAGIKHILNE
jgi:hypothetical protein